MDHTRALAEWLDWQAKHPGPHNWFDANDLVLTAAGAESVLTIGRGVAATYFHATRDRPVKLGVFGPVRLRIEARPLHLKADTPIPLDDWLAIREKGQLRLVAVTGNYPTEGLALVARPGWLAGSRVEHVLEVGPGWHEIDLAPEAAAMLLRVFTWRPEMPLPVLPVLTAATVRGCLHPSTPLPARTEDEEALLLAQGDFDKLLGRPVGPGDADIVRRMTYLVRLAETVPKERPRAEALGLALFAKHPDVPHLDELRQRLGRKSAWALVTDVRGSAGVRRVALEGWQPESPMLLVRRGLIGPLGPNDQVVAGYDRFILSVNNLRETRAVMELALAEVAHLPPGPLTAVYQVDEQAPVKVALTPEKPTAKAPLVLPAGGHSVRVWIEAPVANQYLRVTLSEDGRGVSRPLERTYQVATEKEPVRVAVEGPAWVRIDELDGGVTRSSYQLTEPGLQTLTLTPRPGQREAAFRVFRRAAAAEGREARPRYVRVEQVPVPPPWASPPEAPVAPPAVAPPPDALPPPRLRDLGTFSLTGGYRSRRPLDEDFEIDPLLPPAARRAKPDRFAEARLTHRYFDEWRRTYARTDVLLRDRAHSGPTFGLTHHLRYDPADVPLTFHLEGAAYVQQPAGAIGRAERVEWAGFARAAVTQYRPIIPTLAHAPTAALFGRLMSLERSRYLPGNVDQDIFTPYKAAHQAGWVVSDTLIWSPSLDTRGWAGASLTSNENLLTPDNLTLRLGAAQLIGGWEALASYRYVQFFPFRERQEALARHIFDAGLRCELWYLNRDRVELALGAEYELVRRASAVQAFLTWHFGNGRGYRDFRPDEVEFLDLRRRHYAEVLAPRFAP